eukprot:SAG31_NODE_3896_length_3772_cov_12.045467_3_plen_549_part_00
MHLSVGFGYTRDQAIAIFKELDKDSSGAISFEEYLAWALERLKSQGKPNEPVPAAPVPIDDSANRTNEPENLGPLPICMSSMQKAQCFTARMLTDRWLNERKLRRLEQIRRGHRLGDQRNAASEAHNRRPGSASTISSETPSQHRSDSEPHLHRTRLSSGNQRLPARASLAVSPFSALGGAELPTTESPLQKSGSSQLHSSYTRTSRSDILRTTVDPETPEGRLRKAAVKPLIMPQQHMVFVNLPSAGGHKVALWPGQSQRVDVLEQRGEMQLHNPERNREELPEAIRLSAKTNGPPPERPKPFAPAGKRIVVSVARPAVVLGKHGAKTASLNQSSWLSSASIYSAAGQNDHPSFGGMGYYGVPVAREVAIERSNLQCTLDPLATEVDAGHADQGWLAKLAGGGGSPDRLSIQLSEAELDSKTRARGLPDRRMDSYVDLLGQRPMYPDNTGHLAWGHAHEKAYFEDHDLRIAQEKRERQVTDYKLAKKMQRRAERKWRAKVAANRDLQRRTFCSRQLEAFEAAVKRGEPAAKARAFFSSQNLFVQPMQ